MPPNMIAVANGQAHTGSHSAALTVTAGSDGTQENAVLSRAGGLPAEAYYSAWYYLPYSVSVGTFWVIFKFRMRTNADDPGTANELYDMDLATMPSGEMTLELYDHRTGTDRPLDVPNPIVPVEQWFQLEAFYRAANDNTGRLTYWLNGQQVVDIAGAPTSPTSWVEWDACSVGDNLTRRWRPSTSTTARSAARASALRPAHRVSYFFRAAARRRGNRSRRSRRCAPSVMSGGGKVATSGASA